MFSGTRLKAIRKSRGLTQSALGELVGISHVHVRKMESGSIRQPRSDTVEKLATALDVPQVELFDVPGGSPIQNGHWESNTSFSQDATIPIDFLQTLISLPPSERQQIFQFAAFLKQTLETEDYSTTAQSVTTSEVEEAQNG